MAAKSLSAIERNRFLDSRQPLDHLKPTMIKTILIIIVVIALLILAGFFLLGNMSKNEKAPGLHSERLAPCPDSPNCVVSEVIEDDSHYISPIRYPATMAGEPMSLVKQVIQEIGGEITVEEEMYIAAIFTSAFFGFVDDLECRIDKTNHTIHLRSASRVGHSDFGANRKRVELISTLFHQRIKTAAVTNLPPTTIPKGQL